MSVCVNECLCEWVFVWMSVCVNECLCEWVFVWMSVCDLTASWMILFINVQIVYVRISRAMNVCRVWILLLSSWDYAICCVELPKYKEVDLSFVFCFFSVRLLSVLRGHSFVFSTPPQRPMTSEFEGFSIPDCTHYIYLNSWERASISLSNVQC